MDEFFSEKLNVELLTRKVGRAECLALKNEQREPLVFENQGVSLRAPFFMYDYYRHPLPTQTIPQYIFNF